MNLGSQQRIYQVLRIAVAMCFIGHGAFGIITKAAWCNYFAVVGISPHLSYQLMPVVGCVDILLGIIMLVHPVRAIPAWLVAWGIITALMRPLSGEPFAEFIERAGNFGAPLALILLSGIPLNARGWFTRINPPVAVDPVTRGQVTTCLKLVVFLFLLGHGWLNAIQKEGLLNQYASLGFSDAAQVAQLVGISEISIAFLVLVKPLRPVLLMLLLWKMSSELLYPRYAAFEWIERGGSYGALLALYLVTAKQARSVAEDYNTQDMQATTAAGAGDTYTSGGA